MRVLKPKIILGLDPGFGRMGWGVIQAERRGVKFIACGCIESSKNLPFAQRLTFIAEELKKIIKKYSPSEAGIEKIFFFKNARTAVEVGHSRGVALFVLSNCGIIIKEVTPLEVKQAVTGYGRADKAQVGRMVKVLLDLKTAPKSDDAADALAAALTISNIKN